MHQQSNYLSGAGSWKRLIATVVVFFAICTGLLPSATVPEAAAEPQQGRAQFLIPAYFSPDGHNWQDLCGQLSIGPASVLIMNPMNGVGPQPSNPPAPDNYLGAIQACRAAGQRVIGYVSTDYARRDANLVEEEISEYYSWYGVDGIFLDEMSNDQTSEAEYYGPIYDFIKEQSVVDRRLVVGNPGATADTNWQVDATPVADVIVNFEGTAQAYANWHAPAWVSFSGVSNDHFAHLVYQAARSYPPFAFSTSPLGVCLTSRYSNHGWIDVTYGRSTNPWNVPPALAPMRDYC